MTEQVDEFGLSINGTRMTSDEEISCVHSSDAVHDFFASNGVSACKDSVCKFLGIESADDLKLVTAEDISGSQFTMWARGSLSIVQQKKLLKAFS